jgi:methylmalonyl-CoA/ethylmalonyl-CoA epimerase
MKKPLLKPAHCVISVADMQESIEWYEKMLGLELLYREYLDMLECELAFLKMGDFGIKLFRHKNTIPLPVGRKEPNEDLMTQGIKHVCYETENIMTVLDDLRSKGADIAFGPMKMKDGTLISFVRDNTGNLIEIIQRDL